MLSSLGHSLVRVITEGQWMMHAYSCTTVMNHIGAFVLQIWRKTELMKTSLLNRVWDTTSRVIIDRNFTKYTIQPEEAELQKKAKEEEAKLKKLQGLFSGCRFFLAREVPREALMFVIRSFGGVISWEESGTAGARYPESDENITHLVVDRPAVTHRYLSRLVM